MTYPIAHGLPVTPTSSLRKPEPPVSTVPPSNPAVIALIAELRRIEQKHADQLKLKHWHELLAHRADYELDQISGERKLIEQAVAAIVKADK